MTAMAPLDEDVREAHQVTVFVLLRDHAMFSSEISSAGSARYAAVEKWLFFLCIPCGPGDEINGSLLRPVLGQSVFHIWRIVIARLCLFRSSVSVSFVGASLVRYCAYGMLVRPPALICVRLHSTMPVTKRLMPSRAPMIVCFRLHALACR